MKLKNTIILLLIFYSINIFAQNSNKMNLQQCIDTAINNNLNILQSINSLEINKLTYFQSKNFYLPVVSVSANETYNKGFFNTQSQSSNSSWNTDFGVSAGFILFDGFKNLNSIKQNEAYYKSSDFELQDLRYTLTIEAVNVYLQILYTKEAIKIAENQVNASMEQEKIIDAFVSAGKLPESDLYLIKSQTATDKLTLITGKNQLKTSKLNLQQLMEIPVNEDFDIENYDSLKVPSYRIESAEDIYSQSLKVMPKLKLFEQRIEIEKIKLNSLENYYLPRLSLNTGISTNYANRMQGFENTETFGSQFKNNSGMYVSLSLSIPIFSKFQNKTNIKIQQIQVESSLTQQKAQFNSLRKEVELACNDANNAIGKFDALSEQLKAVRISYGISKAKFESGLLSATDLLIEKNKMIKSESDLLQAKYDLIFKLKILDYYKGNVISIE